MIVQPESFDALNREARPYPSYLLPTKGTALSLFSAGFWGWNDGIHLLRAGLSVDFVDTDSDRLYEMMTLMPAGHAFHVADAWDFAERSAMHGCEWDVVTVDPFMGNLAERAWETLYLWLTIARKMVTLTVRTETQLDEPEGWTTSYFPRNDSVGWMVMRRDA